MNGKVACELVRLPWFCLVFGSVAVFSTSPTSIPQNCFRYEQSEGYRDRGTSRGTVLDSNAKIGLYRAFE